MTQAGLSSKLLFLGSGAADWPPLAANAPFPQPGAYRQNAALLVDGRILVDGGPYIMAGLASFHIEPAEICDLLITHSHSDHYNAAQVRALADYKRSAPLRIWYPAGARLSLASYQGIELHPLRPGEYALPRGYQVLALAANHWVEATDETALMYLFDSPACRWLYATDGSWFMVRTWRRLCAEPPLDALIIDATLGDVEGDWRIFEHNSLAMVRQIAHVMRNKGLLKPDSRVVLTHLARETHLSPPERSRLDSTEGWLTAYDGLELEIPVT
ncbi:MAG: MBL fold metallo-hydrolase [Anaerolineae bacterium]